MADISTSIQYIDAMNFQWLIKFKLNGSERLLCRGTFTERHATRNEHFYISNNYNTNAHWKHNEFTGKHMSNWLLNRNSSSQIVQAYRTHMRCWRNQNVNWLEVTGNVFLHPHTLSFGHSHAVNSHSFPFLFPTLSVIPIPMELPLS